MKNILSPWEQAQLAYKEAKKTSDQRLHVESLKGYEKSGLGFGLWMRRFTRGVPDASFAALGSFTVAAAILVGDNLTEYSTRTIKAFQSGLKYLASNTPTTNNMHGLTDTFGQATTVTPEVFEALEARRTAFTQDLHNLKSTFDPHAMGPHKAEFEFHQKSMSKYGLSAVFFDKHGQPEVLYCQHTIDRLTHNFHGCALQAISSEEKSCNVRAFEAQVNPSVNTLTSQAVSSSRPANNILEPKPVAA